MRLLVIVAALVACSPPPRAETAATPVSDAAPGATTSVVVVTDASATGADAAPADTGAAPLADTGAVAKKPVCPPSFAAAQTAICVLAIPAAECAYPEGECGCVAPPQCGGAYRPTPPGSPGQWRCDPKLPGTLRADGCPFVPPSHGASCATQGKTCSWGQCFWSQTFATCKAGAWVVTHKDLPPPP
ncbi:MAG: hypothetical protein HYV09_11055 [Deltaproteobacteria bacterium]|nr:hypothetical protein [Deltaproteobacteria bacterium]